MVDSETRTQPTITTPEIHSPSGRRLRYLDGWRGLAIAGVFIDHFVYSRGLNTGRLGVELFFVLSGRLMSQILFVDKMQLGLFYYRRFSRVWPTLTIFVVIMCVVLKLFHRDDLDVTTVVAALTYTYNYVGVFGHRTLMLDHLWSLCIEEHSYLYLGIVAVISRRVPAILWPVLITTILACIVDGIVSTIIWKQDYYQAFWRTDVRMSSILLGAAAYLANREGRLQVSGAVPVVLAALGVLFNFDVFPDSIKYSLGTLLLAVGIANLEGASAIFKTALSNPLLVWMGLISYSLYIWQQPFAVIRGHTMLGTVSACIAAVAVGITSFYLAETPVRRWLNSLVRR